MIEQAQMIADLQNSDFISWKENIVFLDNAWTDLYQQIINHGDKAFLETFDFEGDCCELPCDFYQLYYICYNDGFSKRPINRKSKTSISEGPYYDIVGNEIIIYNSNNSLKSIEVSYYPVRDSITYASDDVKVDGIQGEVLDVCNSSVFYKNEDEYFVKDIVNNKEEPGTEGFILSEGGIVDSDKPCFKADNKVYYSEYNDDGFIVFKKINGTEIHRVKVDGNPDFPLRQINGLTDCAVFYCNGEGVLKRFDLETGVVEDYADGLINKKVYSFKNSIYYETTDGVWCNHELLIPVLDYETYIGVLKVDNKTGYGVLFDNFVIKSAFDNTELLFPSNVYYNFMAYKLATYYKIKQGADAGNIAALATDALNVFYDTLPRDENEYVRISNVYAR
ncbi:MAG: hypothetical protein MJZ50_01725 [Treponema sp.]|nr:hypothetical protein [Treponema sp.]